MKDISVLNAFTRENTGSNDTKKIRQEKKIPAIIYGDGKNPLPISLNIADLRSSFKNSAFINKIYDLNIEKSKRVLNWEPEVFLDQGLDNVNSWISKNINNLTEKSWEYNHQNWNRKIKLIYSNLLEFIDLLLVLKDN